MVTKICLTVSRAGPSAAEAKAGAIRLWIKAKHMIKLAILRRILLSFIGNDLFMVFRLTLVSARAVVLFRLGFLVEAVLFRLGSPAEVVVASYSFSSSAAQEEATGTTGILLSATGARPTLEAA